MNIYAVFSHQIPEVWEKVLPLVKSALDYSDGKFTPDSVKAALEAREMQLFIVGENISAIAITQIQQYPAKRVLVFEFCAGKDIDRWLFDLVSEIERWAVEQGCDAIEAVGRPGWEKVLGWERIHVVVRKPLK